MKTLVCPLCGGRLEPESLSVALDAAYCRNCERFPRFSSVVSDESVKALVFDSEHLPDRMTYDHVKKKLSARNMQNIGWLVLPFALVLAVVTLAIFYFLASYFFSGEDVGVVSILRDLFVLVPIAFFLVLMELAGPAVLLFGKISMEFRGDGMIVYRRGLTLLSHSRCSFRACDIEKVRTGSVSLGVDAIEALVVEIRGRAPLFLKMTKEQAHIQAFLDFITLCRAEPLRR